MYEALINANLVCNSLYTGHRKDKASYKQAPPHLLCEAKAPNAGGVLNCY